MEYALALAYVAYLFAYLGSRRVPVSGAVVTPGLRAWTSS